MGDYDETDRQIATLVPEAISTAERQRQILLGNDSASTAELHAGWPFRENNWQLDCALWATRRFEEQGASTGLPPLPPAVQRALKAVAAKPCFETLSALRKAASVRRREWSGHYIARLDEIVERCDIYLWHSGDADAANRCVLRALERISTTHRSDTRDGLLRTALTIAGVSVPGADRLVIKSAVIVEMRARAGSQLDQMKSWLAEWNATQADDGGKPTGFAKIDEVADLPDALFVDESDEASELGLRTLVVVPSLDHLPKPSLGQRDRRDTPRAEFARIENVALPLKRLDVDPIMLKLDLMARYPWAEDAIDVLVGYLVYHPDFIALPPTCLNGPPGCAKTTLAIDFCRRIAIPHIVYAASGSADGSMGGTSRQYSTGRVCVPLQVSAQSGIANPVVIVDEGEKIATSRHNGSASDVLLTMTEPASSKRFFDPYLECPVDLSAVSYLMTVNDPSLLSQPLRDRFRIVDVPAPGPEHVPVIVRGIVDDIRASRGSAGGFVEDLAPDEIELLARDWKPGSMRGLRRAVETVLATRDRLATRN